MSISVMSVSVFVPQIYGTQLFVQYCVHDNAKQNIKLRISSPLGEVGHNSPLSYAHKGPVIQKEFPCRDTIILTVLIVPVCQGHSCHPNCMLKVHQPEGKVLCCRVEWCGYVAVNSLRAIGGNVGGVCGALLGGFPQSIVIRISYKNENQNK